MSKDVVEKKDRELAIYNSYQQLKAIATDLHKSGLFKHLANPQQAIAVVEYGRELGVPPMQALQTMAVINGKIGMESKLLMGLAKRAGYDMEIIKNTDEECEINLIDLKGKKHKVKFDWEEAEQLGVTKKWNKEKKQYELKYPYKTQPANMLLQRCVAKAVRRHAPETLLDDGSGMGMYTIEELSGGDITTVEELNVETENIEEADFEEVKEKPEKKTEGGSKEKEALPEIIEYTEGQRKYSFKVDRFLTKEEQQFYLDKGTETKKIGKELKHRFNLVSYYGPKSPEIFSELRKIRVKEEYNWDDWKAFAKDEDFKNQTVKKQKELIELYKEGQKNG
jgi:hypothetical protein